MPWITLIGYDTANSGLKKGLPGMTHCDYIFLKLILITACSLEEYLTLHLSKE